MGQAGTVPLPRVGVLDGVQVPRVEPPHWPTPIPGGVGGLAPLPAVLLAPAESQPGWVPPEERVPGGRYGPVELFVPAIDKQAPYYPGDVESHAIRKVEGAPLVWRRFFFTNAAGARSYLPSPDPVPSRTANRSGTAGPAPADPLPVSEKHVNSGGFQRGALVDTGLFRIFTSRRRPWPILKPMRLRVADAAAQPKQTKPYPYRLTRYQPAASYGQTTRTLLSQALANLLPNAQSGGTNPQTMGGSPYGSY